MKLAIVGATGLVGSVILKVLEERDFPYQELYLVASEKSVGKTLTVKGIEHKIMGIEEAMEKKPDVAIFSAGSKTSLKWAPKFAENGTFVVDNSSAWRMYNDKKLVVAEINAHLLGEDDKIIANPNCSTMQLVLVLAPLHQKYKIKRVVISTYQSVSGTGVLAVQQMENERNGVAGEKAYKYQIDKNLFPHGGDFLDNGYTSEEMKLLHETRKILGDESIQVTATVVRVPVLGGHSEAVNIEFEHEYELANVRTIIRNTLGVVLQDDIQNSIYPMPLEAEGKDEVFVGRVRRDESQPKSLNLWIVSDNLRKGAATNAVQIAEYLVRKVIK